MLRVWDSLVALLIAFSFFDSSAAVIALAILAFVGKFFLKFPLEESRSANLAEHLWDQWRSRLADRVNQALWTGALIFGIVESLTALRRHRAIDSHAFDLGIFTNAIWNLTHGFGLFSSVKGGISLFADHQSPIFILLAPIFAVFPHPETLLVLQAFGLAMGAVPLYFIARQFLSNRPALAAVVPLLYWFWPPLRNAVLFDFHPEVFMLPLFLAAIAGLQSTSRRARVLGFIAFLLGLATKESAGPVACGIGLAWLLGAGPFATRYFTRKIGIVAIGLGLAVFLLDIKVVPGLVGAAGGEYAYNELYSQYGSGVSAILLAPFTKPALFFEHLLAPSRLRFLAFTLLPLALAPILNPRAFVAALPGYLMLFLSQGDVRVNVQWHYGIEPGVGLFFALPLGLLALEKIFRGKNWGFAAFVVCAALVTVEQTELLKMIHWRGHAHEKWVASTFLPEVKSEIAIAASDGLVPHLATRHWIEKPDRLWTSRPESPDCVIYDSVISNWPMDAEGEKKLFSFLSQGAWKLEYQCGSLGAWSKGTSCLKSRPECMD